MEVSYNYKDCSVFLDNRLYTLRRGRDNRKDLLYLICTDFPNLPTDVWDELYTFFKVCEKIA